MSEHRDKAGIATRYGGIQYRSRLEAKWAAFFDSIGWWHTYEPFDADGYIPDFMIQGDAPLLVEIKPAVTHRDFTDMSSYLWGRINGYWNHDVLILGLTPLPALGSQDNWNSSAGLLGEHIQMDDSSDWDVGVARWFRCDKCDLVGVHHDNLSFKGRPCGHYDGSKHLGAVRIETLRTAWNEAGNAVQWKAT